MAPTLAELTARQTIAGILALHSRGVDRADSNLLAAAYHPGATVDYGFFVGVAADMIPMLIDAQKAGPLTLHRTSNMWLRVNRDCAVSESYVIAYISSTGADARQRLIGGRYLDRHECRGGNWRLSHRTYVLDWNVNRLSTAAPQDPPVALAHQLPAGGHTRVAPCSPSTPPATAPKDRRLCRPHPPTMRSTLPFRNRRCTTCRWRMPAGSTAATRR